MRHIFASLIALCLGLFVTSADAQQQYDPGGKARVSNYCKTTTAGDTPCAPGDISTTPQSVKIDQTTPGTTNGVQVNAALPAGTNVLGHVINDASSAQIGHVVTDTGSLANLQAGGVKAGSQEYIAVVTGITPPATPTDMNCIWGSATKTVVVLTVGVGTNATAATLLTLHWPKRSTADTGGTFVAATPLSPDSADGAATASAGYYTANPAGLGTSLGDIRYDRSVSGGAAATGAPTLRGYGLNTAPTVSQPMSLIAQPLILHGVAEGVCTNFAGAALPAGFVTDYYWQWVEY